MRLRISTIASIFGVAALMAACDLMETDKPAKAISPEAAARALVVSSDSALKYKDSLAAARKADSLAWEAKRTAWKTDSLSFIKAAATAKAAWIKDSTKIAALMKKDSTKARAQFVKDSAAWVKDSLAGLKTLSKDSAAWAKKATAYDASYDKAAKAMAAKYTKDSAAVEALIAKFEKLLEADQAAIDKAQEAVDGDDDETKPATVAAHAKALDKATAKLAKDQAAYDAALEKANAKTTADSLKGEEALAKVLTKRDADSTTAAAKYTKDSLAMVTKVATRVETWASNTTRDSTKIAANLDTFNLKVLTRAAAIVTKDSLDSIKRYEDSVKIASADSALLLRKGVPVFSKAGGAYPGAIDLDFTTAIPEGQIYYTIDGTLPDSSVTGSTLLYTAGTPVHLTAGATVLARAVKEGYAATRAFGQTYIVDSARVTIPNSVDTTGDSLKVTFKGEEAGYKFYWTKNGLTPNTTVSASNFLAEPGADKDTVSIKLYTSDTIKVLAVKAGRNNSAVLTKALKLTWNSAAVSVFYANDTTGDSVQVMFKAAELGTTFYYTLNNTTPTVTTASTSTNFKLAPAADKDTVSFKLGTSDTVRVIAAKTGRVTSAVDTEAFKLTLPALTLTKESETSSFDSVWVKITETAPSTIIRYTLDGTTPTFSTGTLLAKSGDSVKIVASATLKAAAFRGGNQTMSAVKSSVAHEIKVKDIVNSLTPATDIDITTPKKIALTTTTVGDTIYYTSTADGSTPADPTRSSTRYTDSIPLVSNLKIKAIGVKNGLTSTPILAATYTVKLPAVVTKAAATNLALGTKIGFSSDIAGVSFRYTVDGSTTPTASVGTVYTDSFALAAGQTVKVIAYKTNLVSSDVASNAYTIKLAPVEVSVAAGAVAASTPITLTAEAGTSIYYTEDGTTPTSSSTAYTAPITFTTAETIKAIAIKTNCVSSDVTTAAYTITP